MSEELEGVETPEQVLEAIRAAEDMREEIVWREDGGRRIDYILYESASLGKAVRVRYLYQPATNPITGKQVGWFFQGTTLEQVT